MLAGLTDEERSAIHTRLLFAETEPQRHPDYHQRWLGLTESAETYNVTSESLAHLAKLEEARDSYEKGVLCVNTRRTGFVVQD